MRRLRPLKIGCAAGTDQVVVVVRRARGEPVTTTVAVPDTEAPLYERIASALHSALTSALPNANARAVVRVALLPPLAQIRRLRLPPMRADERARVLSRDAAGYFFNVHEPQVAAAHPVPALGKTHREAIAAATPVALLDALRAALPDRIAIDACVPAAAAWSAALPRRRNAVTAAVTHDGVETRFTAERGLLTDVRHHVADPQQIMPPTDGAVEAARNVWGARSPLLRTHDQLECLQRTRSRHARLAVAAAVILTLAGVAASHVTTRRELAAVRSERAALRTELAPALAMRDSLTRLESRLTAARALGAGAPWTELLTTIAQRVPNDAHVVYLVGVGDSVMLRIEAATAANVLPALRGSAAFSDVRIAGAVERDATDPAAATDRFDVAARIRALGEN